MFYGINLTLVIICTSMVSLKTSDKIWKDTEKIGTVSFQHAQIDKYIHELFLVMLTRFIFYASLKECEIFGFLEVA